MELADSIAERPNTGFQASKHSGYGCLIFFSMLYVSLMLCSGILTNRYVSLTDHIFVLGGTLTSPLIFVIGDIVAEIYGYKVTRLLVWFGYLCQTFFVLICSFVTHMPYPSFFTNNVHYSFIFDQLPSIVFFSFVAFIVGSLINARIITQWKILVRGRYYWLRSLGSSTIAEAIYTALAIIMMEINKIGLHKTFQVILVSYLIKVIYSVVLAFPTNLLVYYIKKITKVDVYDKPMSFNPFITQTSSKPGT